MSDHSTHREFVVRLFNDRRNSWGPDGQLIATLDYLESFMNYERDRRSLSNLVKTLTAGETVPVTAEMLGLLQRGIACLGVPDRRSITDTIDNLLAGAARSGVSELPWVTDAVAVLIRLSVSLPKVADE